jgi:hypothetical protein
MTSHLHRIVKRLSSPSPSSLALGVLIGVGIGFGIASITFSSTRSTLDKRFDTVSVKVNGVRIDAQGGGPLTPRPGSRFVITDITLENRTPAPVQIAPLLDMYLKDSEGRIYPEVAVPSAMEMKSGNLPAHDKLREEVGFDVPSDVTDLRLYYEPEVPNAGTQIVALPAALTH